MTLGATLERTIDAALHRSPAQPLLRWRTSRQLRVLAYHEVPDAAVFTWQADYMRTRLHPVCLSEVLAAIRTGGELPPGAVLITFDDGDRSVYETALPILKTREMPAVTYPVAGVIGTDTSLWWREAAELLRGGAHAPGLPHEDPDACIRILKRLPNEQRMACLEELRRTATEPLVRRRQLEASELRELEASGIAIGNHTLTHPCLDQCSAETIREEIRRAHDRLTEILGRPPVTFAYPNGNHDPRAERVLAELGYRAAFLFDHRIGRFPPADPYRISRVRINTNTNPDRFRILLSGLHCSIHRLMGRE